MIKQVLWAASVAAAFASGYYMASTAASESAASSAVVVLNEYREEEDRRHAVVEEVSRGTGIALADTSRSVVVSGAIADGLRVEIANLQRRHAGSQATCDARIAGQRSSAQADLDLLAELYREAVSNQQLVAAEAERYRVAGESCALIYDGVRGTAPITKGE